MNESEADALIHAFTVALELISDMTHEPDTTMDDIRRVADAALMGEEYD